MGELETRFKVDKETLESISKIAENAKTDLIQDTNRNVYRFEISTRWGFLVILIVVGLFVGYLSYSVEPIGLTLKRAVLTYLFTFIKGFGPTFVILTAFYLVQFFLFRSKIANSKGTWFKFFRKEAEDENSADGIFLLIKRVKKSIEYGLTWVSYFSTSSRAYLDVQKIQFRVVDAKNLLINGLSTYGIYSDKYKDAIEKSIKINEDQSQAIEEITKEVWSNTDGAENPNMSNIFYFIYLERRNDPQKTVVLKKIISYEKTKKEFSNILLGRLTLKLGDPWTESIKEWIAMETLLLSKSDFNLERFISKYDETVRSILGLVRNFKTMAMKYGLVFESERLVGLKLPNRYNLNDLRNLIAQEVSITNLVDSNLVEMLEKFEENSTDSTESLDSLKKNPSLLKGFYTFLMDYDVLNSLIEFEDFQVIFRDIPSYSLEKLQYSCNTLASYINYHRGAIVSLRQLKVSLGQNIGIDMTKIKKLLKLNNTSERQSILSILGELTYEIINWDTESEHVCNNLESTSLEKCRMDYSLFLVVLLINFYRGNISSISVSTINKGSLDYENLDYRLFNYMKYLEQNPAPNLLEFIRRAFANVFENQDDPNLPLFKDKLGLGQLPRYKELAKERVDDAYKLINEAQFFNEGVKKQGKLIKVLRRFMEYEVSSREINNLIRGGIVEAYLLNVGTEGGKTLTLMGGPELEYFGKFLDRYSRRTGKEFLRSSAFLMVSSAGMAARIGLIPPSMSFEDFSSNFNEGLKQFLLEKEADTSDVYLSRIFASEESFSNLLSEPNEEPTHLKIIRQIISKKIPSNYVASYLAATRHEKVLTPDTIKDLITTIVNSRSGGYYGFNNEFFEKIGLSAEDVLTIENSLKIQFESDLFVNCCVKINSSILKEGADAISRRIRKIVISRIKNESLIIEDDKVLQRLIKIFIETSESIAEIFR